MLAPRPAEQDSGAHDGVRRSSRRSPANAALEPSLYEGSPAPNSLPPTPAGLHLSEGLLFRLWAGQRFPASALVTAAGEPLRVLQPGRPGRGAGPDFRDAIIAPPAGSLLRGDVELHVRARDFEAHGHHLDARYDRVVLHVVFDARGRSETTLRSGRSVAVVPLAPWLERRQREISGWLERPGLWREPCHDAIVRLGAGAALAVLDRLGEERFARREQALSGMIDARGPGEALYRALLEGAGYGDRQGTLVAVADALPYGALSRHLDQAEGGGQRATLAEALLVSALPVPLGRAGTRPANRPARRLAGLARLLARHHPLQEHRTDCRLGSGALIKAWSSPPDIGRSRAIELVTNAVLPWVAALAEGSRQPAFAAEARLAVAALPRPAPYGALSFLEANLSEGGKPLPLTALRQQGLLELYKSDCSKGGCGRCGLS